MRQGKREEIVAGIMALLKSQEIRTIQIKHPGKLPDRISVDTAHAERGVKKPKNS